MRLSLPWNMLAMREMCFLTSNTCCNLLIKYGIMLRGHWIMWSWNYRNCAFVPGQWDPAVWRICSRPVWHASEILPRDVFVPGQWDPAAWRICSRPVRSCRVTYLFQASEILPRDVFVPGQWDPAVWRICSRPVRSCRVTYLFQASEILPRDVFVPGQWDPAAWRICSASYF